MRRLPKRGSLKQLVARCWTKDIEMVMIITVSHLGARSHELDREQFRLHGHDPDVPHFEDPGPYVVGCPFDPRNHCHSTSPKERQLLPRSKWYSSKTLDELRLKVRDTRKERREEKGKEMKEGRKGKGVGTKMMKTE